jgi:hypothetical protein
MKQQRAEVSRPEVPATDSHGTPIPENVREVAERFLGCRVLIRGDHPHAGEVGTVARVEMARATRKWGFVVELDDGGGCFVFKGEHWQVIR